MSLSGRNGFAGLQVKQRKQAQTVQLRIVCIHLFQTIKSDYLISHIGNNGLNLFFIQAALKDK